MRNANPLIRLRRRLGKIRRRIRRAIYERRVGRRYRDWLAAAAQVVPESVENQIRIAVIVPVFDTPPEFLRACLASVRNQSARNWLLIVSDDGSTDPTVLSILDELQQHAQRDERIRIVRGANQGISAACNRALELVDAEYFGWLDHDDALDPRCLAEFSAHIYETDVDLAYSDEDKIDSKNQHFELYCKPDYSPELLLSQMYLCHFTVFRTKLVREVGGFNSTMDGAQDFDLALRLMPRLRNVKHIPLPLYHWRAWSGSTAQSIDAKPWAQLATARAQQAHLDRTCGGLVKPSSTPGLNEVRRNVPSGSRVSVIIPTMGTHRVEHRFVDSCVTSLVAMEDHADLELIIVTTGDVSPVELRDSSRHAIKYVTYGAEQFNFAEAINLGRRAASGDWLLLLNDDTAALSRNPVTAMLETCMIEGVGVTGAKLTYPDGRLQHVGMLLSASGPTHPWIGMPASCSGYFGSTLTPRNVSAVTAAAMLVRSVVFDEVGGFDTGFARDFNDVDFCMRVRQAGFRVAWTPYAHFEHHEGASMARKRPDAEEEKRFTLRWHNTLPDPYYSPKLNPDLNHLYEAL